jgi:hypothetical protein
LGADGGFGFIAGGGFGFPSVPGGVEGGAMAGSCARAFHEREMKTRALKRRVRKVNVFMSVKRE